MLDHEIIELKEKYSTALINCLIDINKYDTNSAICELLKTDTYSTMQNMGEDIANYNTVYFIDMLKKEINI